MGDILAASGDTDAAKPQAYLRNAGGQYPIILRNMCPHNLLGQKCIKSGAGCEGNSMLVPAMQFPRSSAPCLFVSNDKRALLTVAKAVR